MTFSSFLLMYFFEAILAQSEINPWDADESSAMNDILRDNFEDSNKERCNNQCRKMKKSGS